MTGVQTCALPIYRSRRVINRARRDEIGQRQGQGQRQRQQNRQPVIGKNAQKPAQVRAAQVCVAKARAAAILTAMLLRRRGGPAPRLRANWLNFWLCLIVSEHQLAFRTQYHAAQFFNYSRQRGSIFAPRLWRPCISNRLSINRYKFFTTTRSQSDAPQK